jgi:NADPH2:quinone reductase
MKAILIRTTGGPSVLEYVDLPDPVPGPGEVLVRAAAIGVNRPDVLIRKGEYPWMPPLPTIPGIEMSGTVEAVGPGVTTLAPGDKVAVSARDLPERGGCYAELIAVPEKAAYAMPAGCDVDAAACLANYQVAYLLLTEAARGVPEAGSVYVAAASGGIGNALVQLARQQGRTVVAGVGSVEKAEAVKRLGADHVVLTRETEVVAAIRAATGGTGVDLVLDPIGGDSLASMFGAIAPFGLVVSYGRLAGRKQADLYEAMFKFQTTCPGFRIFTMHAFDGDNAVRRASMRELLTLLAEGRIAPPIARRFPLSDAAAAHALMESRTITGNIVLKP